MEKWQGDFYLEFQISYQTAPTGHQGQKIEYKITHSLRILVVK